MKLGKKFISLLLTITILIGTGGCMTNREKAKAVRDSLRTYKEYSEDDLNRMADEYLVNKEKNQKNRESEFIRQAQEHLTSKYGKIEFEVLGIFPSGFDYPYDFMNVYLKGEDKDETEFEIRRYKEKGKVRFEDSYFGLQIRDEFEGLIKKTADSYFPEYKVRVVVPQIFPNYYTKDSTLRDAADAQDLAYPGIIIMVEESFETTGEFYVAAEEFIKEWEKFKIQGDVRIMYLIPELYEKSTWLSDDIYKEENQLAEFEESIMLYKLEGYYYGE